MAVDFIYGTGAYCRYISGALSSTYFRLEKHNLKKAFKNKIGSDEIYKIKKKKHEKNILYVFAVVVIVLLIAAIFETIVLSSF